MEREEMFRSKVEELLKFVISKDEKYAGKEPLANIKDLASTWGLPPWNYCCMRIHEKLNRLKRNNRNKDIIREELRDIWGYCLLGLLLLEEEEQT